MIQKAESARKKLDESNELLFPKLVKFTEIRKIRDEVQIINIS